MSLRGFHVVFITCSIFLLLGFAYWAFIQFVNLRTTGYLATTVASCLTAIGLVIYEIYFLRKVKV